MPVFCSLLQRSHGWRLRPTVLLCKHCTNLYGFAFLSVFIAIKCAFALLLHNHFACLYFWMYLGIYINFFQSALRSFAAIWETKAEWVQQFISHSSASVKHIVHAVQFKIVSMHSEKPTHVPPHLSEVSPTVPLKRFQYLSDWRWPFLILLRKIIKCFFFPCPSPPDDWWCDVLGFEPTGSVSSSSKL